MKTYIYLSVLGVAVLGGAILLLNPTLTTKVLTALHAPHVEHDDGHGHTKDEHAGHDHSGHSHAKNNPKSNHASAEGDDSCATDICPEHRVPEAEDALCQAEHIGDLRPGEGLLVRLESKRVAAQAGVLTTVPTPMKIAQNLSVPARLLFNRERTASIAPVAPGTVRRVHVRPGTRVKRGDLLVEISTPELAPLQAGVTGAHARLSQAQTSLEREQDLLAKGISSQQEYEQAKTAYASASSELEQYRQQLLNFGLDAAGIASTTSATSANSAPDTVTNLAPIRAPFGGIITNLATSIGEVVTPASVLLTLADPDILWLELSIPATQAGGISNHSHISVHIDGATEPLQATLFHVDAALDEQSRTLRALAHIPNPDGHLKAGMFARADIATGPTSPGLALPADAIQHIDGDSYIFIQQQADLFELRRVNTGAIQDGLVGISAGLDPSHDLAVRVVSARGFALKSEVLRARLGASCADH
ncbi:MAG: efflux RND transporter periplasmic adaptor subunit [Desulfuromonadaceae bacterium]|nr:efflux RND transporter periplasmic adaptor subunit [Desulfuromonas sp.]MDY0213804.1 efflux RND transporter periplasmic adaptor subunit [Desulfuromonadaceae bacterium]